MAKNGLISTNKCSASVLKIITLEKMAKTITFKTGSAPSKSLELRKEERPKDIGSQYPSLQVRSITILNKQSMLIRIQVMQIKRLTIML